MELPDPALRLSQRIAAIYAGDAQTRAAALWDHCCDVVDTLDAFVPEEPGDFPPVLDRHTTAEIQSALDAYAAAQSEPDALTKLKAQAFATWRNDVLDVEARNAGRLTVLAGALRRLHELRGIAESDPKTHGLVLAMIGHIDEHLAERWRTAFPANADPRQWPIMVTRRYDLLPVQWRFLSPRYSRDHLRRMPGGDS